MTPEPLNDPLVQPEQHENENFHESYYASSEDVQSAFTDMLQPTYPLTELEYFKIEKGESPLTKYTWEVFIITAGYAVLLLAKFLGKASIENWEYWGLGIAIISFIVLFFIIERYLPSEKKVILNNIQNFFDENQPSFEIHKKKL